jgi:hypothetical protein
VAIHDLPLYSGHHFSLKFNDLKMTFNFVYNNNDEYIDESSTKNISKADAYGADDNNMEWDEYSFRRSLVVNLKR